MCIKNLSGNQMFPRKTLKVLFSDQADENIGEPLRDEPATAKKPAHIAPPGARVLAGRFPGEHYGHVAARRRRRRGPGKAASPLHPLEPRVLSKQY
ncbi:Hypothetical predicted protein [Podarcis lilfordi]|uniref:Uncharacterized protein n=1 Tax=Podarcis lilfordi TaxID=74358 RepID=A0AA35L920_9SAUR|nr:Hypothetical predicted protein [Podarcis lilfordi]